MHKLVQYIFGYSKHLPKKKKKIPSLGSKCLDMYHKEKPEGNTANTIMSTCSADKDHYVFFRNIRLYKSLLISI